MHVSTFTPWLLPYNNRLSKILSFFKDFTAAGQILKNTPPHTSACQYLSYDDIDPGLFIPK
jgi:hypothetical protein